MNRSGDFVSQPLKDLLRISGKNLFMKYVENCTNVILKHINNFSSELEEGEPIMQVYIITIESFL